MPAVTADAAMTAARPGLLREWPPDSCGRHWVAEDWAVATATHGVEPEE